MGNSRSLAAAAVLAGLSGAALGQPCPSLTAAEPSAIELSPYGAASLVVFDVDGPGPGPERLVASGPFTRAGMVEVPGIAVWNGDGWSPMPVTPPGGGGTLLVVGTGPGAVLYSAASGLHRFDGQAWSSLSLPTTPGPAWLLAMAAMDPDAIGPLPEMLHIAMSVGGDLYTFRLDGGGWVPLGTPPNLGGADLIMSFSMIGYDPDGPGPAAARLHGFASTQYLGLPMGNWMGRLDGQSWTPLGGPDKEIGSFCVHDEDGPGPARPRLYVGGRFSSINVGGSPLTARGIAAWDGLSWSAVGAGWPEVGGMVSHDVDGAGPEPPILVTTAGERFGPLAMVAWNGAQWAPFAEGRPAFGPLISVAESGQPSRSLVLGGALNFGGTAHRYFAVWRGDHWIAPPLMPQGTIRALTLFDPGAGTRLFAGGGFDRVGTSPAGRLASWDGNDWTPVWPGVEGNSAIPLPTVYAVEAHNDGSGMKLYVAGSFAAAAGLYVHNIARWDGQAWSRVGQLGPHGGPVYALESHDPDGAGPIPARLYAGGFFTTADGIPARRLAMWDGVAWSEPFGGTTAEVRTLLSWDDGSGPALYVGGLPMSPAGLPASPVGRLAASGWTTMPVPGSGGGAVNALAVHDDGLGGRLLAAGDLGSASGPARLARLERAAWVPVSYGSGGLSVRSVDEGRDRAVYLGTTNGLLRVAGGLETGIGETGYPVSIRALSAPHDDGLGRSIFVARELYGGAYASARLMRLRWCPGCYANCDGSTVPPVLNVADFVCFQNGFAAGLGYANCDGSSVQPVLNVGDFVCFLNRYAAGCP